MRSTELGTSVTILGDDEDELSWQPGVLKPKDLLVDSISTAKPTLAI